MRSMLLVVVGLLTPAAVAQLVTPPDRTVVTGRMLHSELSIVDMNGDCGISDVDYALFIESQLVSKFGPDLAVGDLDGDGFETGEDVIVAIAEIVRASFGKVTDDASVVTPEDVAQAVQMVVENDPDADLNQDGMIDLDDALVPITHLGDWVLESTVQDIARDIFYYMGVIREKGHEAFIVAGCVDAVHLHGISSTWPHEHPGWWRDNHSTGVSRTYDPLPPHHSQTMTQQNPDAPAHDADVSRSWPPNHMKQSSATWLPPPDHGMLASIGGDPPPAHHTFISETWPAGHTQSASQTWGPTPPGHTQVASNQGTPHNVQISRTWWPHHTQHDSNATTWPPLHTEISTWYWGSHNEAVSQSVWPPNHHVDISRGWGPGHSVGISQSWPPSHVSYASNSWPGPQPSWPPSHTRAQSEQWGVPDANPWPIFPPDHSWWTTIQQTPGIIPRFPWSTPSSE